MSEVTTPAVVEVFGKFAIETEKGIKTFDSRGEAEAEAMMLAKGAEFEAKAVAFCEACGVEGKNAKGKMNVIVSFLAWEAGRSED